MSHYITYCSCGKVISQCRCPSDKKDKTTISNGCSECKAKLEKAANIQINVSELQKRLEK